MLSLPTSGFSVSVSQHNSDLMVAADWVELCCLLSDESMSSSQIVDLLEEGDVYRDQGFAAEFVESIFSEIRRRSLRHGQECAVAVDGDVVRPSPEIACAGLKFCLLLSLGPKYSGWNTQFNGHYTEQGELFERLVADALHHLFPSWTIARTGWGNGEEMSLEKLVDFVAQLCTEERVPDWDQWLPAQAKDIGVDLAAARPFGDGGGGIPVMLWQCASGANWPKKLSTPDTKAWDRVITLTHTPLRGFATPVVIPIGEFRARRNQAHGVLLDRTRLLPNIPEVEWLDRDAAAAITAWVDQRVAWLTEHFSLVE